MRKGIDINHSIHKFRIQPRAKKKMTYILVLLLTVHDMYRNIVSKENCRNAKMLAYGNNNKYIFKIKFHPSDLHRIIFDITLLNIIFIAII